MGEFFEVRIYDYEEPNELLHELYDVVNVHAQGGALVVVYANGVIDFFPLDQIGRVRAIKVG